MQAPHALCAGINQNRDQRPVIIIHDPVRAAFTNILHPDSARADVLHLCLSVINSFRKADLPADCRRLIRLKNQQRKACPEKTRDRAGRDISAASDKDQPCMFFLCHTRFHVR